MILRVIGQPCITPSQSLQKVIVTYNHIKDLTIVDCDVDIVTLGIAVNILQQCYNEYLNQLEPSMAKQIHDTITKVVNDNEEHSGKSFEPIRNRRFGEANGGNG